MKIYRFPDTSGFPGFGGHMTPCSNDVYFRFTENRFILISALSGFCIFGAWRPYNNIILLQKADEPGFIYKWNVDKYIPELIYGPHKGSTHLGWGELYKNFLVYGDGGFREEIYTVKNLQTESEKEIKLSGFLLYFDDDKVVFKDEVRGKTRSIRAVDWQKKAIWMWEAPDGDILDAVVWHQRKCIVVFKQEEEKHVMFTLVPISTGIASRSFEMKGKDFKVQFHEEYMYVNTGFQLMRLGADIEKDYTCIEFKHKINKISVGEKYIYAIGNENSIIFVCNKKSLDILKSREVKNYRLGVSFDSWQNLHGITLYTGDPLECRGFSWIGLFTDEELLSDDELTVEVEPAFYRFSEQVNFDETVSIEVRFDDDLSFDDLYRHAATGIQSAAWRNAYANPQMYQIDKSYNDKFSGKVIANFENYSFNDEQKKLIEDLCQRCSNLIEEMDIKAGDKKTKCSLVSIIQS